MGQPGIPLWTHTQDYWIEWSTMRLPGLRDTLWLVQKVNVGKDQSCHFLDVLLTCRWSRTF